jgi:hypothetical protein
MTVPPIHPDLDCFPTVRDLTDLLIGKGLTGTEQREVIEKTRVQFNEAYRDVIEELLGLELGKLERAQTAEVRDTIEDVANDPGWQEARAAAPVVERSHVWVDPVSTPDTQDPDQHFGVQSAFAARRFTHNGQTFTDLTIRAHLNPAEGLTPQQVTQAHITAQQAVDHLNSPGVIPPLANTTATITLEFTDAQGTPHLTVDLADDDQPTTQHRWQVSAGPLTYAHEILHQLGLRDERTEPGAEHRPDTAGSLMGQYAQPLPDAWQEAGLTPGTLRGRHAQLLEQLIGDLSEHDTTAEPGQRQQVPAPSPQPESAPAERVGGQKEAAAGTGKVGTSSRPGVPSAFLDAPGFDVPRQSFPETTTGSDQQSEKAAPEPTPVSRAPQTTPVKAMPAKVQGQSPQQQLVPRQTRPVQTPEVRSTAPGDGLVHQAVQVTPPVPSGQADAIKQLALMMTETDMKTATDQLNQAQQDLEAAITADREGTADSPCGVAVAQAVYNLAQQQLQSAQNSYNALTG